jgi:hypothetical protein
MMLQSAKSTKQAPEPEVKPERSRGGDMLQVVNEFFDAINEDQNKAFTPKQVCEKINVKNHHSIDDLVVSLQILKDFNDNIKSNQQIVMENP